MNDQIAQALLKSAPLDRLNRPLRRLRVSVTDRCNLRCTYCMPEDQYNWLERKALLTFEEITILTNEFIALGVNQVRLTGGEPLLRRGLEVLVAKLAALPQPLRLAMTTNGSILEPHAQGLRDAGLSQITVSLDTLIASRYLTLTGRDELEAALNGIHGARRAGYESIKLNMVVMRGFNDDELTSMLRFAASQGAELRFIEYMDVGGANRWNPNAVVSATEILQELERHMGPIAALGRQDPASPATRFALQDGTTFGIIASTTRPFCGPCDRSRITADGQWLTCLYARQGVSLRDPLRHQDLDRVRVMLREGWSNRRDRGAEERTELRDRGPLVPLSILKENPHLEMHTRGG